MASYSIKGFKPILRSRQLLNAEVMDKNANPEAKNARDNGLSFTFLNLQSAQEDRGCQQLHNEPTITVNEQIYN